MDLPGIEVIRMFAVTQDEKLRFNSMQVHRFLSRDFAAYKGSVEYLYMLQVDSPSPDLKEKFKYREKLTRLYAEPMKIMVR